MMNPELIGDEPDYLAQRAAVHQAAMNHPLQPNLGGGSYLPREQAEADDKRAADEIGAVVAALVFVFALCAVSAVVYLAWQIWPLVAVRLN